MRYNPEKMRDESMVFYTALFLTLFYFKIGRVHKKEERMNRTIKMVHVLMIMSVIGTVLYGYDHLNPYRWVPSIFLFAIIASMFVTAVQVGIFVDGKPLFKLSDLYRLFPIILVLSIGLNILLWM